MTAESGLPVSLQPQWLSDVLTELSAVAHGYVTTREGTQRVLAAVPAKYRSAAGLVTEPIPTLEQLLGHDDPDGTCRICVEFKAEMAAIAEAERAVWRG